MIGAPERTRTFNPRLRRPMLYPVELRAPYQVVYPKMAEKLVGVERFELPTSCSQSRRATRLRYTPNVQSRDRTQNCTYHPGFSQLG